VATSIDRLFDPAVVQDPNDYYAQLRETDPVHEIPGTGAFLVTRMALIHEVVARPSVYSSQSAQFLHLGDREAPVLRGLGNRGPDDAPVGAVLATADPPVHTRQRKVVSRRLTAAAVQALEPEFRELVDRNLDMALATGRMDWMAQLAEPLPMVMVARILGLPDGLALRLKSQGYASVEAISGFVSDDRLAELDQRIIDVGPVAEAFVAARSSAPRDAATLIGICAQAVDDGDLDEIEAFAILFLLVAAGGESTTSLTGTGVRILAERPDLQARLRDEPYLVPTFVEEACRTDPPFRGHYRHVVTDTELGGVKLPAGSTLVLAWPAANRDVDAFSHADEIDLDRPNPRQHAGFGWGIHLCVGAPLARMEANVAFEQLLSRTASFGLDPSAPPLRFHESLMIRRLVALPLLLEPGSR
jgi:cytochrome P450 family 144